MKILNSGCVRHALLSTWFFSLANSSMLTVYGTVTGTTIEAAVWGFLVQFLDIFVIPVVISHGVTIKYNVQFI